MIFNFKTIRNNYKLISILAIGFILRLISINQSLWLDEAIQAQAVITNSLSKLFTNYLPGDFNPPLSYLISFLTVRLFGNSEFWLRLPSVLFGLGNIALIYFFWKKMFAKKDCFVFFNQKFCYADLVALLFATAPLHIYYSQEARPYALAVLLATWSMYELWQLINYQKRHWWHYCLATTLMLYSHYSTWLIMPAQIIIIFSLAKKISLKTSLIKRKVWASWFTISLLLLPWLATFIKQIKLGNLVGNSLPAWRRLGELSFKNLSLIPIKFLIGRISIDNNFIYALVIIPLLAGVSWLLLKSFRTVFKSKLFFLKIFWLWLIIPLFSGILLSIKVPILEYFRFLFLLPAFYFLLTLAVKNLGSNKLRKIAVLGFLSLNLITSLIYLLNPKFHRENWKTAVGYIKQKDSQSAILILKSVEAPFWYYDKDNSQLFDYSKVDKLVYQNSVWLVGYAQPIFDPNNLAEKKLRQFGLKQVFKKDFRGVLIKYYINPKWAYRQ